MVGFGHFSKLRIGLVRSKYHLHVVVLMCSFITPLVVSVPATEAAPTFNSYQMTSSYDNPGKMTVAGGSLFYIEGMGSSNTAGYIGKRDASGTITDYDISTLAGLTNFQISYLTTGPDGNVWFDGCAGYGIYAGALDASTGAVTMYSNSLLSPYGGCVSGRPGPIAAAVDGKIWYVMQGYTSNNTHTYMFSVDLSTGATTQTWGTSSNHNFSSMTTGPDGRLWLTDLYFDSIQVQPVPGSQVTTPSTYNIPGNYNNPSSIIVGVDGNLWFAESPGRIAKITPSGTLTEYPLPTNVYAYGLTTGPDGNVWFTRSGGTPQVGRITSTGTVTMYNIPGTSNTMFPGIARVGDTIWYNYRNSTNGWKYYLGSMDWN